MQILTELLFSWCKQIGIPQGEEPILVWDKKTFALLTNRRRRDKWTYGACSFTTNSVLIDMLIKDDLRGAKHTLAHELVHMRWQKKSHGKLFNYRVQDILRGKEFPERTENDVQPYYKSAMDRWNLITK